MRGNLGKLSVLLLWVTTKPMGVQGGQLMSSCKEGNLGWNVGGNGCLKMVKSFPISFLQLGDFLALFSQSLFWEDSKVMVLNDCRGLMLKRTLLLLIFPLFPLFGRSGIASRVGRREELWSSSREGLKGKRWDFYFLYPKTQKPKLWIPKILKSGELSNC